MAPPNRNNNARQNQQQLHESAQLERDNNNNTTHQDNTNQLTRSANELIVVDLVTQDTSLSNSNDTNNNPHLEDNDFQSLAADTRLINNGDDILIFRNEQNDNSQNRENNSNMGIDNEMMHFNGIQIRNSNNTLRNRTNPNDNGQTRPCHLVVPTESISDNARSGIFQPSVSAINGSNLIICHHEWPIADNAAAAMDRADRAETVERQEEERGGYGDVASAGDGAGDGVESTHVLYGPQNIDHFGSVNSAFVQIATASVGDLVPHDYHHQRQRPEHNSRRRRRRGRRGQGGDHQQRNQIRRSLKAMNKILRKTVNTLRRIKSLIMQQVQMARDYHMNVPMTFGHF